MDDHETGAGSARARLRRSLALGILQGLTEASQRPPAAAPLRAGDVVLGLGAVAVDASREVTERVGLVVRPLKALIPPPSVVTRGPTRLLRGLAARGREGREDATTRVEALVQRVAPVVVDRALGLVDLTDLVHDHVDLDTLVADVDIDAVAARLDLDAVLDRVDINEIAGRLDVNAVAGTIDLDAILDRVDINEIAGRLDVNAVAATIDLDAILDRVDINEIAGRLDVTRSRRPSTSTPWCRGSTLSRSPSSSSRASTCRASSRARPGRWPPWRPGRCAGRASAPTNGWSTSSTGCCAARNAIRARRRGRARPGGSRCHRSRHRHPPPARTSQAPYPRRGATGWRADRGA